MTGSIQPFDEDIAKMRQRMAGAYDRTVDLRERISASRDRAIDLRKKTEKIQFSSSALGLAGLGINLIPDRIVEVSELFWLLLGVGLTLIIVATIAFLKGQASRRRVDRLIAMLGRLDEALGRVQAGQSEVKVLLSDLCDLSNEVETIERALVLIDDKNVLEKFRSETASLRGRLKVKQREADELFDRIIAEIDWMHKEIRETDLIK